MICHISNFPFIVNVILSFFTYLIILCGFLGFISAICGDPYKLPSEYSSYKEWWKDRKNWKRIKNETSR